MDRLVDSSPKTREWLDIIKSNIKKISSSLEYKEHKYWASFRNPDKKRNIVQLHPQKTQIRLFTRLPSTFNDQLEPTPSTGIWAEKYPSIFKIKTKQEIDKAIELILKSYRFDLSQQ
jgi:predicted transport protein